MGGEGFSDRLRLADERVAVVEMPSRILAAMLPSHGYQGFRAAPIPSGWVQMGECWVLWWRGRHAHVRCGKEGAVCVHLDTRKIWRTKDVPEASIAQGKRYAERWCVAKALPRAALARSRGPTSEYGVSRKPFIREVSN